MRDPHPQVGGGAADSGQASSCASVGPATHIHTYPSTLSLTHLSANSRTTTHLCCHMTASAHPWAQTHTLTVGRSKLYPQLCHLLLESFQ